MADFELIVFDWDGTLMDSTGRIVASLRAAGNDMGFEDMSDRAFANVIGLGLQEAIQALYPDIGNSERDKFLDCYRQHFLFECSLPEQLFEGAMELLQELSKSGLYMAIATGKSRVGLDRALDHTECGSFFHTTRCADETSSKPDPHMLNEIIKELGVSPDKTLMVGDTEYDMKMARNAGTAALAVGYGAHEPHRLDSYQPLANLDSMKELRAWFEKHI